MKDSKINNWHIYGNDNPNFVVAGHSHAFPMFMAVENRPKYKKFFGVISQKDFSKPLERDHSYWDFVRKKSKRRNVVLVWNGNQHNFHFLIATNEPFKVFNYFENDVNAPAVSISRVKELFKPTFDELKNVIKNLDKASDIVIIGTPRPKSKKHIDRIITTDPFFVSIANQMGIDIKKLEASSDDLRIAMWKLTQDLTKQIAEEFGIRFIGIPDSVVDENGLLRIEYWTDDISHANEEFGAVMFDEILSLSGKAND